MSKIRAEKAHRENVLHQLALFAATHQKEQLSSTQLAAYHDVLFLQEDMTYELELDKEKGALLVLEFTNRDGEKMIKDIIEYPLTKD